VHPVRAVLAAGPAGTGCMAHRLVAFNPAEAGRDRRWCGAGVGQEHPVPAGQDAWLSRVTGSLTRTRPR